MAAARWIMINVTTAKIEHVGVCMAEHLTLTPCPPGYAVILADVGDCGQYWNGVQASDGPPERFKAALGTDEGSP